MRTYVLRRFLQMIPLLFGISALTFLLLQLAPGDFLNQMAENPAISADTIEAMRRNFGLDQPWYVQYGLYLRNVLFHFDFGESFSRHQPVFTVIREGLQQHAASWPAPRRSSPGALAIPLGIWAAVRQYSWIDRDAVARSRSSGCRFPRSCQALLLLMLAARTGWFPVGGMRSIDYDELDRPRPAVRPGLAPGAAGAGRRAGAAGQPHAADARQPARRAAARLRHHRARRRGSTSASSSSSTRCATR